MVVCMSRRICVALYNQIVALRPEWHRDDDAAGTIKVVMTGSAADPQGRQPHIGTKTRRDVLAKSAKDPKDELKLVIVRDMWLTGFDAPSMHTMSTVPMWTPSAPITSMCSLMSVIRNFSALSSCSVIFRRACGCCRPS